MEITKPFLCLHGIFLIVLALAAISVSTVAPVAAISNTPTYVLGVSNPTDPLIVDLQNLTSSLTILPSVSPLGLVSTNSILFIDGTWLQTVSALNSTVLSLIVGKVVSGLPTVVVRGNPALLGDSISGLTRFKAQGVLLIAEGDHIASTLADGTRVGQTLEVISGFDYAVATEFSWAQQSLPTAGTSTFPLVLSTRGKPLGSSVTPSDTTGSQAFWQFQLQAAIDTGNAFAPFGRVITSIREFSLQNSGTTSFRWKNFFLNSTVLPGIAIYGSNYRTDSQLDNVHPNSTANVFVNHGPGSLSSSGPFTVSYSIGVQATVQGAVVTATQNQSYALKNTSVTDLSQNSDVSWIHSITSRTSSGTLTFQIIPGWTLRVDGTQPVNIVGSAATTFVSLSGTTVQDTQTRTVFFSAFGG